MLAQTNKRKKYILNKNNLVYLKNFFKRKIFYKTINSNKKLMFLNRSFNKNFIVKKQNFRYTNICLYTGKFRSIINYSGFKRQKFKEILAHNYIPGISKLHK